MAAAKKKKRRVLGRVRVYRRRHAPMTSEERRYRVWSHDFDAVIHGLVRNQAALKLTPAQLVARAAQTANEMQKVQDASRPPGVEPWF
jgi:hypothetical protein